MSFRKGLQRLRKSDALSPGLRSSAERPDVRSSVYFSVQFDKVTFTTPQTKLNIFAAINFVEARNPANVLNFVQAQTTTVLSSPEKETVKSLTFVEKPFLFEIFGAQLAEVEWLIKVEFFLVKGKERKAKDGVSIGRILISSDEIRNKWASFVPENSDSLIESAKLQFTVPGLYFLSSTPEGPFLLTDFVGFSPQSIPHYPDPNPNLDRWYFSPRSLPELELLRLSPLVEEVVPVPTRDVDSKDFDALFLRLKPNCTVEELPVDVEMIELRKFAFPYSKPLFEVVEPPPDEVDPTLNIRFLEKKTNNHLYVSHKYTYRTLFDGSVSGSFLHDWIERNFPSINYPFALSWNGYPIPEDEDTEIGSIIFGEYYVDVDITEVEEEEEEDEFILVGLWGDKIPRPKDSTSEEEEGEEEEEKSSEEIDELFR